MGSPKLSARVVDAISANDASVFVSAVTAFELSYKVAQDRWPEATGVARNFAQIVAKEEFLQLDLSIEHALRAGAMDISHKDPFDRMLLAQAEIERLTFVTIDGALQTRTKSYLW